MDTSVIRAWEYFRKNFNAIPDKRHLVFIGMFLFCMALWFSIYLLVVDIPEWWMPFVIYAGMYLLMWFSAMIFRD